MKHKLSVFFTLLLILSACAAPTPAVPTPTGVEVTVTLQVTVTSTSSPLPAPTEASTPPETAVTIASMEQFDRAWFEEEGKTVKVTDLYGAGETIITVAEIKAPAEGQVLTYKEMETFDLEQITKPYKAGRLALGNLTVERMSLLQIDIADNARMTDGDWVVFRMGTMIGGEKVSFDVFVAGGSNYLAKEVFADWQVGDVTDFSGPSTRFNLNYCPDGGMTIDDWDKALESHDILVFLFLGNGGMAISRAELLEMIRQGGVLDKRAVYGQVMRP